MYESIMHLYHSKDKLQYVLLSLIIEGPSIPQNKSTTLLKRLNHISKYF